MSRRANNLSSMLFPAGGSLAIALQKGDLPIVDANHDPAARRGWLLRTLQGTISATVIAVLYPVARFLKPRRATASGALEMVAPYKPKDLINTSSKPFNFAGKPCLLVLLPEGAKRLAQGQRLSTDDLRAFNAICTHVACTVKYRPTEGDIFCNCHDGVYDLDGRNVSGPPPRPLEIYKVTLRGEPGQEEIVVSRQT
jgi:cytochrome b6-f complex iron-sulfur subunit